MLIFHFFGTKGKLSYIIHHKNIYVIKKKYVFIFIMLKIWYSHHNKFLKLVYGVSRKWNYSLLFLGLGYKVYMIKNLLILKLGFSHLICCSIPQTIKITIKKKCFRLESINYYLLKQIGSFLKVLKLPDIYKGKGLYTLGEKRLIKQGKVWQR